MNLEGLYGNKYQSIFFLIYLTLMMISHEQKIEAADEVENVGYFENGGKLD